MKKRICALLCVLLLMVSFTCGASALIMVEDETGTRYSDESMNPVTTTTKVNAVSEATKKAMSAVSNFWHRFGLLTVVIVLLVAIVVAIVISEFERQKKEQRPPKPSKKKKK